MPGTRMVRASTPASPRRAAYASPSSRRMSCSAPTTSAGGDIVTVEGTAAVEPDSPRADRVEAYMAKYQAAVEALGYEPGPFARTYSTAIRIRPPRIRAW